MKEELRPAICMKGEEAIALLARWLSWAARCQIPPFVVLGAKIRRHRKNAAACLLSSSVYRRWPCSFQCLYPPPAHAGWRCPDIRGKFNVRQMKDPKVGSFSPTFHFTEPKSRVSALYCVLAFMVARLMVRQAEHAGMHMSVRELLDTLAGIEETLMLYEGARGRPVPGGCSRRSTPPSTASTTLRLQHLRPQALTQAIS